MRNPTDKQTEILAEYKRVQTRVNKRLENLEKLAKNPGYENVLKYAYRIAERDVKELGIGDTTKVRYRIPYDRKTGKYNTNKLKSALRRAKEFEAMITSTKAGIDTTYKNDAIYFNRAFGTNFTWEELRRFMKQSDWDELKANRPSDVIQKVIRTIMKKNITPDQIAAASKNHKTIKGMDAVTSDWTKRLVSEGLDVSMLSQGTADKDEQPEDFVNAPDSPFID